MTDTAIVKGLSEALNRGDIAHVLNGLADNVEWVVPGPNSNPFAGRFQGREAATGFFQKAGETTELAPLQIDQYVEQGDLVIAPGSSAGRSKPLDTAAVASAYVSEAQAARG